MMLLYPYPDSGGIMQTYYFDNERSGLFFSNTLPWECVD
jgi:hypothetical protein